MLATYYNKLMGDSTLALYFNFVYYIIVQGSWKIQSRRKFKNLRRPGLSESGSSKRSREESQGQDENHDPRGESARQPKRAKSHSVSEVTREEEDMYEQKISELYEEVGKSKPRKGKISSLMRETFKKRRQWIVQDMPSVEEVLEKFPALKKGRTVS